MRRAPASRRSRRRHSKCSQLFIFPETVWEAYDLCRHSDPEAGAYHILNYAARTSFKTLAAAAFEVLATLHLSRDCLGGVRPLSAQRSRSWCISHFELCGAHQLQDARGGGIRSARNSSSFQRLSGRRTTSVGTAIPKLVHITF